MYGQNRTFYKVPKSRIYRGKQGKRINKGYIDTLGPEQGLFLLRFFSALLIWLLFGGRFGVAFLRLPILAGV